MPLSLPLSIVYWRNLIARVGYYFSVERSIQIVPQFKLILIVLCAVKDDLYRHTHTHTQVTNQKPGKISEPALVKWFLKRGVIFAFWIFSGLSSYFVTTLIQITSSLRSQDPRLPMAITSGLSPPSLKTLNYNPTVSKERYISWTCQRVTHLFSSLKKYWLPTIYQDHC